MALARLPGRRRYSAITMSFSLLNRRVLGGLVQRDRARAGGGSPGRPALRGLPVVGSRDDDDSTRAPPRRLRSRADQNFFFFLILISFFAIFFFFFIFYYVFLYFPVCSILSLFLFFFFFFFFFHFIFLPGSAPPPLAAGWALTSWEVEGCGEVKSRVEEHISARVGGFGPGVCAATRPWRRAVAGRRRTGAATQVGGAGTRWQGGGSGRGRTGVSTGGAGVVRRAGWLGLSRGGPGGAGGQGGGGAGRRVSLGRGVRPAARGRAGVAARRRGGSGRTPPGPPEGHLQHVAGADPVELGPGETGGAHDGVVAGGHPAVRPVRPAPRRSGRAAGTARAADPGARARSRRWARRGRAAQPPRPRRVSRSDTSRASGRSRSSSRVTRHGVDRPVAAGARQPGRGQRDPPHPGCQPLVGTVPCPPPAAGHDERDPVPARPRSRHPGGAVRCAGHRSAGP